MDRASIFPSDRVTVMGVLNLTPDSFSDGGRWTRSEGDVDVDAVTHCMADVAMALVDDDARRSSPALSRRLSAISGRVGDWRREAREETLLTECAVSEKRVDGWFMEQQRWFITEV